MSELRKIPNVGKTTEKDLIAMGYTTIESLKGKTAEQLYEEECALRGEPIDRCQLYLYRAVEYFVNSENPDLSKCPWWLRKDEFAEPSPCGAVCTECGLFPKICEGCRKKKEKCIGCNTRAKMCAKFTIAVSIGKGRRIAENATICLASDLPKTPRFPTNRTRKISKRCWLG